MKLLIAFIISVTCFGQEAAKTSPPAPTITLAEQADWLQARAELAEAQLAAQRASDRLAKLSRDFNQRCPLEADKNGRPQCKVPAKEAQ